MKICFWGVESVVTKYYICWSQIMIKKASMEKGLEKIRYSHNTAIADIWWLKKITRYTGALHKLQLQYSTLPMLRILFRSKAIDRRRWEDSDGLIQCLHQYAIVANQWYVWSKSTCLNFDIKFIWCCFGPSCYCMLRMWLVLFTSFFSFSQLGDAYNITTVQSNYDSLSANRRQDGRTNIPPNSKHSLVWICEIGSVDTIL